MGRANDKIAREQERYIATVSTGWLESLERSLAQMKEYQVNLITTKNAFQVQHANNHIVIS